MQLEDPRVGLQLRAPQTTTRGPVAFDQQTDTPADNPWPEFLSKMVEPYVQQKEAEGFFNGYVAQQAAGVAAEVADDGGPIARIFGPTAYQEGASFYRGDKLVSDKAQAYLAEQDTLKKLPPEEFAKKLATDAQSLMTGNQNTDAIIRKRFLEVSGPVIQTIQKARHEWQQTEAKTAQVAAIGSAATALQGVAVQQFATLAPGQETNEAIEAARRNFLVTLPKAPGQMDDSYKDGVMLALRGMAERGEFHALNLVATPEVLGMFTPEDQEKFEAYKTRFAAKANQQVRGMLSGPIDLLNEGVITGRLTAEEARAEMGVINEAAYRITGSKEPLFDAEDMEDAAKGIVQGNYNRLIREQEKLARLQEAQAAGEALANQQEAIAQAKVQAARDAVRTGAINSAITLGLTKEADVDMVIHGAWQSNDLATLSNALSRQGYIPSRLRDIVGAEIKYGEVEGYTNETQITLDKLEAVGDVAAAYLLKDDYYTKYRNFRTIMRSGAGTPAPIAWARAFGQGVANRPLQGKDHDTRVKKAVEETSGGWLGIGRVERSPAALNVIRSSISSFVAANHQNGPPNEDTYKLAHSVAIARGALEDYGTWGVWRNAEGTKPLWQVAGMSNPGDFRLAFNAALRERMVASGSGLSAATNIEFVRNGSSVMGVYVKDGVQKSVLLTVHDIQKAHVANRRYNTNTVSQGQGQRPMQ